MVKILSSVTLILMLILMPPATLMYASNNALPGQTMYPVKRFLERGILFLASLTPVTKAYFAMSQTKQRFNEAESLLIAGNDASSSLNELVGQTEQAAFDINNLSSAREKYQLMGELSDSIGHYQSSLQTASQTDASINYPSVSPQPSHLTAYQYASQKSPQPTQTNKPPPASSSPVPAQTGQNQLPPPDNSQLAALIDAQRRLEELKKQLEQQQKQLQEQLQPQKQSSSTPNPSQPQPSPVVQTSPVTSPSPVNQSYSAQDLISGSSSPLPSASTKLEYSASPSPTASPSQHPKSRNSKNSDHQD